MPLVRTRLSVLSLLLCLGCASAPLEPLDERLLSAPPGSTVRLILDDAGRVIVGDPVSPDSLPPAAVRVVESVQPGGEMEVWREHHGDADVLRVRSRYAPSTPGPVRELQVTPSGDVVRRMHALDPTAIGEAARDRIRALRLGKVVEAFAVEDAGGEGLRLVLLAPNGARYAVETTLEGGVRHVARLLDAEIEVTLPR